ncbi:hypothetical protein GEV33_010340 [Tenebrio molitor]|uniref:RING-type domain-containing protein n=1 Tax=Tenebrio molitor TaxID=7067 RepID=A0A8J6LGP0_TENMO|nr:hypothetical protein GEV33_010340 [Tenebrio molitor]
MRAPSFICEGDNLGLVEQRISLSSEIVECCEVQFVVRKTAATAVPAVQPPRGRVTAIPRAVGPAPVPKTGENSEMRALPGCANRVAATCPLTHRTNKSVVPSGVYGGSRAATRTAAETSRLAVAGLTGGAAGLAGDALMARCRAATRAAAARRYQPDGARGRSPDHPAPEYTVSRLFLGCLATAHVATRLDRSIANRREEEVTAFGKRRGLGESRYCSCAVSVGVSPKKHPPRPRYEESGVLRVNFVEKEEVHRRRANMAGCALYMCAESVHRVSIPRFPPYRRRENDDAIADLHRSIIGPRSGSIDSDRGCSVFPKATFKGRRTTRKRGLVSTVHSRTISPPVESFSSRSFRFLLLRRRFERWSTAENRHVAGQMAFESPPHDSLLPRFYARRSINRDLTTIRCGCESISESSLVVRRRPGSPIRRYQRMRSFFRRLRSIRPSGSSLPDHGAIGKLSNEESSFELLRNGEISSVDEKNSDVGRCRKVAVLDGAGFVAAPRGGRSGFYFINGEVVWFTRNYHVLGQMNVDDDATVTNSGVATMDSSQKHEKIKLVEINSYLTCYLCKGYLIDATTISECLHSFCRSCIIKFLQENCYCPVCEVIINKAKPCLKLDKTLQDIVYKLVPGLFVREMQRRKVFYQSRPGLAPKVSPEERGEDTERTIFNPQDAISLSLEYISGTRGRHDMSVHPYVVPVSFLEDSRNPELTLLVTDTDDPRGDFNRRRRRPEEKPLETNPKTKRSKGCPPTQEEEARRRTGSGRKRQPVVSVTAAVAHYPVSPRASPSRPHAHTHTRGWSRSAASAALAPTTGGKRFRSAEKIHADGGKCTRRKIDREPRGGKDGGNPDQFPPRRRVLVDARHSNRW